ncbi:potassium-transporting ATPase subunit KdpA [Pseudaquidulcibacter saccharophilus]|uniref:potassium-transporting ATPase subunit KdpA n=1 Tax=Pseudaquidulcibacter saccharophilus TaxID=2831900 RepID=UPI001EFF4941|nr:potassium-transporting ATPase subunit KdpA [Pseudaquidulcibacter saccharophilus]
MAHLLTMNGLLQLVAYFLILAIFYIPIGNYMANVFSGKNTVLSPIFKPIEKSIYNLLSINPEKGMNWREYAITLLAFSFAGFVLLYLILLFQGLLPFNPQKFAGLSPHLAFNTAVSFITNTNWQSYGGESTLSYFSQMAGLCTQNFVSAAVGLSVLIALIRGLRGVETSDIGNFWADVTRANLYILLPLSLIVAILLGLSGVIQNFQNYLEITTLEGAKQTIAMGPVASQEAIKMLGTNGGGFFNVNSAHPFENPTPISNFIEVVSILLIPVALCQTYGVMVNDKKQGLAIIAAMVLIFAPLLIFCVTQEQAGNHVLTTLNIDQSVNSLQAGGNMEGKETRFGIVNSALWASATTAASNGSVNAMHDSFTPLGGLVPMVLMMFGEVVFGGVGSGLYGMLHFVIMTVFIAGLMVGRTPEYLGKKIQSYEMKMASLAVLVPSLFVLIGVSIALMTKAGQAGIFNNGAQGFSEVLYAFTSAANNNGSAFAGLGANSPFYNTLLGVCMLAGRYWIIIPTLALAGSLAGKKHIPISAGTLPTHTPLFVGILIGVIILVGVLTYAPSLALGPVVEHLHMIKE